MVESFLGSSLCERVRAARRVRKELPFAFPLAPEGAGESILVNGVLDVHARGGRRHRPRRSTTSPTGSSGADPVAFCDEHYGTQRVVYALAALQAGAERVDVVHAFLELPDDPVTVTFTRDDAPGARGAARRAGRRHHRRPLRADRRPAPRAVRDLPGTRGAVLLGRVADARREARRRLSVT